MWWPRRLRLGNSQSSCRTPLSFSQAASASLVDCDLERDGAAGLLLDDRGPLPKNASWRDIADLQLHEVAASQLGVDAAVEEG